MKGLIFLALSFSVLVMTGCDSNRVYEDQKDFTNRIWAATDTAHFEFQIQDTGVPYNLYYTVRNSVDYPYSRLFVDYALSDSVGNKLREKLLTTHLFDLKTGEPGGTSGLGDLYDHRELLLANFEFNQPGRYRLSLNQSMRSDSGNSLDSLGGILAVGVRVEIAKK